MDRFDAEHPSVVSVRPVPWPKPRRKCGGSSQISCRSGGFLPDTSYTTGVDSDRRGELIRNHRLFLSVGHDEYWSGRQRRNVEAARDAGVHLGFFSGNEVFWKTRFEPSIDGSEEPYRTLVTYKETHANAKIDPMPDVWTGTWRDSRSFNPEGPQPENALTGTIFTVNAWRNDPIIVPAEYAQLRFWRNTDVARLEPDERAVFLKGLLGHEWDEDLDNGFRPPGLFRLSETTIDNVPYVQDCGSVFDSGTTTHHLTLYRHASGALVFGAGTVQWAWGLDAHHDTETGVPPERVNENTTRVGVDPNLGAYRARLSPTRQLRGRDASSVDRALRPAAGSARVQPVICNELPGENVVPARSVLGRRAAGNSLHLSNRDSCAMLDSAPISLTRAVREARRESSPSQAGPPWRC